MNENRLTQLLDDATRSEPPMGPVVRGAMLAGDRLRWRRRIQVTAAIAAVTALAAGVPAFAFRSAPKPTRPPERHRTGIALIATSRRTVVLVNLATGRAGRLIRVPAIPGSVAAPIAAAAPGGKTIWITGRAGLLTPISVRTGRAGTPIPLPLGPRTTIPMKGPQTAIITGHGRAYVAMYPRGLLAVDLTSRKVLADIPLRYPTSLAASPDGKLLYVVGADGSLTVISTQTNTVLRTLNTGPRKVWLAPDGTTVYWWGVVGTMTGGNVVVTRVDAVTGATSSFTIKNAGTVALAPSGSMLYATGNRALYAVDPGTGKIVARWPLAGVAGSWAPALAVSPDGSTAYVLGQTVDRDWKTRATLDIVNLRTGRTVRRISMNGFGLGDRSNWSLSPDGRTIYVERLSPAHIWYAEAIDASSGRLVTSTKLSVPAITDPDPVIFGR